jgi:ATP-dependent Zn protease
MVFEWGMSPFGFLALSKSDGNELLASQQTFHEAEQYVKQMLEEQYRITTEHLRKNRAALDLIASELILRETISGEDVRRLLSSSTVPETPTLLATLAA